MAEMLQGFAGTSDDQEFYLLSPPGYKIGATKYVVVLGSVISGVGKGIFSASLGKVLQDKGLAVSPLKFDGYLNVDAGTLNPYRHGEVFVLDDGTECDMDLGNYERFLQKNLSRENYLTSGKIFTMVLDKERRGGYLGKDVQFVPHVTGEIIGFLRELAVKQRADVVLVEVGGTVGDVENSYFIEAMRELAYAEGEGNVCFVNVTYIMEPPSTGEQKSKAAQLGVKRLQGQGIQPHVVVCRCPTPLEQKVREKVSVHSNVPLARVIGLEDKRSIYEVPAHLRKSGIDQEILRILHLTGKDDSVPAKQWEGFVSRVLQPKHEIVVGITGKYTKVKDSYASILHALEHAGASLDAHVSVKWIETTEIEQGASPDDVLAGVHGIIVPGGFGKRGTEGKIACVRHARERRVPYLGLCFGFQMAVAEFARNVCGLQGANSTELGETPHPVIDLLPEQHGLAKVGGSMRLGGREVKLRAGSLVQKLYGSSTVRERFRHRYEVNPAYIDALTQKGLLFSGEAEGIMKLLELPGHPFFVGTQAHPEFRSRPLEPHPLFVGFVAACQKTDKSGRAAGRDEVRAVQAGD